MAWKSVSVEKENWLYGWSGFENGRWRVTQCNFRIGEPRSWHIEFDDPNRGWCSAWAFRKRFSSAEAAIAAIEKQQKRTPVAA